MTKLFIVILLFIITFTAQGQSPVCAIKYSDMPTTTRLGIMYQRMTPTNEVSTLVQPIAKHPAMELNNPEALDSVRNLVVMRCESIGKDSLMTHELLYVLKPYLDWMQWIDPHLRVDSKYTFKGIDNAKSAQTLISQIKRLGVRLVLINDTLVVNRCIDPQIEVGDMIVRINDADASQLLNYSYHDRYQTPITLLKNYNARHLTDKYAITLLRKGKKHTVNASIYNGTQTFKQMVINDQFKTKLFEQEKIGYLEIGQFYPDNSYLIKHIKKTINEFKKKNITSVILDLRRNSGGNGDRFDELLSIFIDKPSIQYLKNQKLRVSPETVGDYDFLNQDMIGQVVDIPEECVISEVKLNPKHFIHSMKYYVLQSKDTGSVAASFCNIMHYNNAATLVGEPLLHNAVKYGEIIPGSQLGSSTIFFDAVSTTEYNEYTKAIDGVLYPDVHIPYVASEYMTGKDAVLEKLLTIIKNK